VEARREGNSGESRRSFYWYNECGPSTPRNIARR
jgi:hypothetical protein